MYSHQDSSNLLTQYKQRQAEFLQEAERERLVQEAKQLPTERAGLRQQLGVSLVKLGQKLISEGELA